MPKTATAPEAVLGLDVGKSSHWACLVTRDGETAVNSPVANSEGDLDRLFSQVDQGTLVVVDQVRNIGALAIRRARMAGLDVAYLPGIAAHGAARLFAGDAKTDERDAMVIAKTALGIPDALLPVPRDDARLGAARSMAAQRDHMVTCATREKNRLRSILLESCPPFEALADPSDPRWVNMLEKLGGPWGGRRRRQGRHGRRDEGRRQDEDGRRMGRHSQLDPVARIHGGGREPAGHDARQAHQGSGGGGRGARCPDSGGARGRRHVRMPAHRTGDRPADRVRARHRHRHRRLPRPSPPGILLRHRAEEPPLGHLRIVGQRVQAGQQEAEEPAHILVQLADAQPQPLRRALPQMPRQGLCHGEALKAVARKRIKVVYAIMRDKVPYAA